MDYSTRVTLGGSAVRLSVPTPAALVALADATGEDLAVGLVAAAAGWRPWKARQAFDRATEAERLGALVVISRLVLAWLGEVNAAAEAGPRLAAALGRIFGAPPTPDSN